MASITLPRNRLWMWTPPCNYIQSCPFLDGCLQSSGTPRGCQRGSAPLGRGPCPLCGSFIISRECSVKTTSQERPSLTRPQRPQHYLSSLRASRLIDVQTCWLIFPSTGTAEEEQSPAQGHWADAEPRNEANLGLIPSSFYLRCFSPDPEHLRVTGRFG